MRWMLLTSLTTISLLYLEACIHKSCGYIFFMLHYSYGNVWAKLFGKISKVYKFVHNDMKSTFCIFSQNRLLRLT